MTGKIENIYWKFLIFFISLSAIINSFYFEYSELLVSYIVSFVSSVVFSYGGLKIIKRNKLYQRIREVGPTSHLKKENTPTIGGVFFISAFLLILLITDIPDLKIKIAIFLSTLGFLFIGFSDDILSIKKKVNLGLTANEKLIYQCIISSTFIFFIFKNGLLNSQIFLLNNISIDLSILILPLSIITIISLSNAVNLTDGLDGLAAGCSAITFSGLGTEILINNREDFMIYSLICYAMSGVCLGFLLFNKHPAKIFMGDAGSLSIGAILGFICVITGSFLTTFIFSGVFFLETFSVIVQVSYFKLTKKIFGKGKRILLMSPLHHHFELLGIKENKIVENFWKFNLILVILGIVLKTSV